ncbi:MAG: hypothetical protein ACUVRX_02835 [Actinomycetota bacterium]
MDACFESMSGLATTGLTLVHDLDHMAYGMNLWRHLIMFLGGQGIVVLVVSYFMAGSSVAAQLYVGEGRESILPNVVESSRFIWRVNVAYLVAGTLSLGTCLILEGMAPVRSFSTPPASSWPVSTPAGSPPRPRAFSITTVCRRSS